MTGVCIWLLHKVYLNRALFARQKENMICVMSLNPEPVVRGKVAHLCSDGKTNLYFSVNQRKVVHYDLVAKKLL